MEETHDLSKLRIYSIAVVTEDKIRGSKFIKCWPSEQLNLIDGMPGDYKRELNSDLPTASGKAASAKVEAEAILQAEWFPLSISNRETAPDVCKNELVILFRFADDEKYFWVPRDYNTLYRKTEHVVYSYVNSDTPLEHVDETNSYRVTVSTKDKYIRVQTANNDKEPFKYDVVINTKDGEIIVADDNDDLLHLNSKERTWTLKGNVLEAFLDDKMVIHATKEIILDTPLTTHTGKVYTQGETNCDAKVTSPNFVGPLSGKASSAASADCC